LSPNTAQASAKCQTETPKRGLKTVAYVVCAGAGLDTGADSVPYIAGWAGGDALEQLQKAAELIDGLARRIEQAIAPVEAPDRELVLGETA
jgi:hypothetical protein